MARRTKGALTSALTSAEAFSKAVDESEKYLTVIDIHQGWCGPCTVIDPVLRKLFVDLDRAEERIKIYTIDEALLSEHHKKTFHVTSCKPLFVVYKQKVVIAKISGVNAPELESTIVDNVPALEAE